MKKMNLGPASVHTQYRIYEDTSAAIAASITRRTALRSVAALAGSFAGWSAWPAIARADAIPAPAVACLSRADGVAALGGAADSAYYDGMGLLEIRARVDTLPADASLADARAAVRAFDLAGVQDFSDDEQAALRGVVARLQPLLVARGPLFARTPWSFIKLADRCEGGMPHTRGPHVVIPAAVAAALAKGHRALQAKGSLATSQMGFELLVHEQTHVLERLHPERFEPLFTDVFGFVRMTPAPSTPWIDAHRVHNPDGPDVCWAFPLERIGGSGWAMPDVLLPDVAHPRMPADFRTVAIDVARDGTGWRVVTDGGGRPRLRDLDGLPGYGAHFPWPDEDFHPHEIAAVMLSHWVPQDAADLARRPLIAACAEWARRALA